MTSVQRAPEPGRVARATPPEGGPSRRPTVPAPTPLWAALGYTFVSSLSTGVVTTGIYFLAREQYDFSRTSNYLLGLLVGLMYIPGALLAGPGLRWLRTRAAWLNTRGAVAACALILGLVCFVPMLVTPSAGRGEPGATPSGGWSIWLLMAVYSPVTGVMWPMVESYVSGGRSGPGLRSAIGRFNITWSSAVLLGMFAIGPFIEHHALGVLAALGGVQVAVAGLLVKFARDPAAHLHEAHQPHPPVYERLLGVFRVLLPTSYFVLTALNPYLASVLDRMRVPTGWQTPLAAAWMFSRFGVFALLERWHGWHGRWTAPVAGGACMLAGFAAAVLSPLVLPALGTGGGVAVMVAGLLVFGAGMGTIYCGALYYVMEVGQAEVDAGGSHEALIGVGYTIGPLCGLGATLLVGAAGPGEGGASWFEPTLVAIVTVLAVLASAWAARSIWRHARPG